MWHQPVSEHLLTAICHVQRELEQATFPGYLESYPTYDSLAIHFDQRMTTPEKIQEFLETDLHAPHARTLRHWQIPVCYNSPYGIDLHQTSERLDISKEELIHLHSSGNYLVHFLGFLPGFLYLSGLPDRIHLPRKPEAVRSVPKGAVAIGGSQTGIYPQQSPGGWHIIGQTPVRLFNAQNTPPCEIQAGDRIHFLPVSKAEFNKQEYRLPIGL